MPRACRSTGMEEILDPGWAAQQDRVCTVLDSCSSKSLMHGAQFSTSSHLHLITHRSGTELCLTGDLQGRSTLSSPEGITKVKSRSWSFSVTQEDCDPFEINSCQIKNEIWREVQIVPFVGATVKSLSSWPTFY